MNITIYTTNTCAYCAMVKKYLDSKKHTYDVINVDEHPEKRQEAVDAASGALTVPITVIEGKVRSVIVGWNAGRLAEALRAA